jgi:hypothetical protein
MRRHARWVLLFVPLVLLAGCGLLGSSSSSSSSGGGTDASGGNAGKPWLVYAQGSPTPTPAATSGVPPYPVPTATGFLPLGPAPARATPTATCSPDTVHFSSIKGLDVAPGTTSAVVSFYNVGGYNLIEYRLTAISQDVVYGKQRDVGWVTVRPKTPCGTVKATITGLDRRTAYVFSLDAVINHHSGDGTHAGTLYRSGVVRTR